MPQRSVWAQVTDAGETKTWHLEGLAGMTRCGRSTHPMKGLPRADWGLVLRPCTECRGMRICPWQPFHPTTPKIWTFRRTSNRSLGGTQDENQTSRDGECEAAEDSPKGLTRGREVHVGLQVASNVCARCAHSTDCPCLLPGTNAWQASEAGEFVVKEVDARIGRVTWSYSDVRRRAEAPQRAGPVRGKEYGMSGSLRTILNKVRGRPDDNQATAAKRLPGPAGIALVGHREFVGWNVG